MSGKITLYRAVRGEYTEKKSRFIASLFYVETEEEVENALASVRKEFYDARHHCSAYVLLPEGAAQPMLRSSDDGEPQGTAGHPMLDVLTGRGMVNILAVVTRYFGGTLLGTGGLVRSYTKAVQDALDKSVLIERKNGTPVTVTADYTAVGKLDYYFAKEEIAVLNKEYGQNVTETVLLPEDIKKNVIAQITQITGGKGALSEGERVEYAVADGRVLVGEALRG